MYNYRKCYKEVFAPVLFEMEFSLKGSVFHRLVNKKIIQMLSYKTLSNSFTIQFGIYPLCAGYEYLTFTDERRLGSLLDNEAQAEWDYGESDCDKQMSEALAMCKEYLFPYFEHVTDYQSYYNYQIEEFKRHINMLSNTYKKINGDFLQAPKTDAFFTVSLAIGNYEAARKSRESLLKQNENAELNKKSNSAFPWPEIIRKRREEYFLIKSAMDDENREVIDSFIKKNEQHSFESYAKKYNVE